MSDWKLPPPMPLTMSVVALAPYGYMAAHVPQHGPDRAPLHATDGNLYGYLPKGLDQDPIGPLIPPRVAGGAGVAAASVAAQPSMGFRVYFDGSAL